MYPRTAPYWYQCPKYRRLTGSVILVVRTVRVAHRDALPHHSRVFIQTLTLCEWPTTTHLVCRQAPFMPLDGPSYWTYPNGDAVPEDQTPYHVATHTGSSNTPAATEAVKPLEDAFNTEWVVVISPATDSQGWQYGSQFAQLEQAREGGRACRRGTGEATGSPLSGVFVTILFGACVMFVRIFDQARNDDAIGCSTLSNSSAKLSHSTPPRPSLPPLPVSRLCSPPPMAPPWPRHT
jgi:hypothetical protein